VALNAHDRARRWDHVSRQSTGSNGPSAKFIRTAEKVIGSLKAKPAPKATAKPMPIAKHTLRKRV